MCRPNASQQQRKIVALEPARHADAQHYHPSGRFYYSLFLRCPLCAFRLAELYLRSSLFLVLHWGLSCVSRVVLLINVFLPPSKQFTLENEG